MVVNLPNLWDSSTSGEHLMDESLSDLLTWCAQRGIVLDDRIEIGRVPDEPDEDLDLEWNSDPGALAVRVLERIPQGDTCKRAINLHSGLDS